MLVLDFSPGLVVVRLVGWLLVLLLFLSLSVGSQVC